MRIKWSANGLATVTMLAALGCGGGASRTSNVSDGDYKQKTLEATKTDGPTTGADYGELMKGGGPKPTMPDYKGMGYPGLETGGASGNAGPPPGTTTPRAETKPAAPKQ